MMRSKNFIHAALLCAMVPGPNDVDGAGPDETNEDKPDAAGTEGTTEGSAEDVTPVAEAMADAGLDPAGAGPGDNVEIEPGSVEIVEDPEVQGGTLILDGVEYQVSAQAIARARTGDHTLAMQEIEAVAKRDCSLKAALSVEMYDQTSIREGLTFLENLIAHKLQRANKNPGSFRALLNSLQEFNVSNSSHRIMDMVHKPGQTEGDDPA